MALYKFAITMTIACEITLGMNTAVYMFLKIMVKCPWPTVILT